MAIMILFLALTVAFVIGTIIYLNYKKKNVNTKIKQSSPIEAQEKGKKTSKQVVITIIIRCRLFEPNYNIKKNLILRCTHDNRNYKFSKRKFMIFFYKKF